jgi:hypothetical protein
MTTERWLPVVGWEGLYEVSDQGRVRSLDRVVEMPAKHGGTMKRLHRGTLLKNVAGRGKGRGWKGSGDYYAVQLSNHEVRKKQMVHRLVLAAFVGPDPTRGKMDGAHADGNTLNNRLENLRWAMRRENMADMAKQGRKIYQTGQWSKLELTQVLAIREAAALGLSITALRAISMRPLSKSSFNKIVNDPAWLWRNFGIAAARVGRRA